MAGTTDPRFAANPSGKAALSQLESESEVHAAVAFAAIEIDLNRARGVARLVDAMKTRFTPSQIQAVSRIDDDVLGEDLPSFTPEQYEQYEDCPPLVKENNEGSECDQLVEVILAAVKEDVEEQKIEIEQDASTDYGLGSEASNFIGAWAVAAQQFGAEVAAVYAKAELRAAKQCDDKTNAHAVARYLGVKQGIEIVKSYETWAIKQVESCVVNTDIIAIEVERRSMTKVESYMRENPVCEREDISRTNAVLIATEKTRKEGIVQGITQQVKILKQVLYKISKTLPCYCETDDYRLKTCGVPVLAEAQKGPACWVDKGGWEFSLQQSDKHTYPGWLRTIPAGTFCCRVKKGDEVCVGYFGLEEEWTEERRGYCVVKNEVSASSSTDTCMSCDCRHRHVGSPLVLDLDDDGLTFADNAVEFDLQSLGSGQLTAWIGPRDALLAIDLDGDGRINSGAELFGNASDCDSGRCYDGVTALAVWDAPARGGNGDGQIDARDAVFARLLLWNDRDGDALSSPSELSPASERIVAIQLDADYAARRHDAGVVSARIEVQTTTGVRTAHDVWFNTKATFKTLALPRR